jgi:hypothetical protein
LQAFVRQALIQIPDELLLFLRADVVQLVVGGRAFEQREIFLVIGGARVIEYDD